MPIYTYRREDGTTFEQRQSFADDPLALCPTTGQSVVRVVQMPGIIFKGSGFYVNDSKKANNGNLNSKSSKSDKDGDSKPSDSKPTSETKTETKPEKKAEKKTESAAD